MKKYFPIFAVAIILGGTFLLLGTEAEAIGSGPNFPSSGTNDASIGSSAWLNPGNITLDDGNYASSSIPSNATSNRIKAQGFGFSIPSDATITGVLVEPKVSAPVGANVYTIQVALLDTSGTVVGAKVPTFSAWTSTFVYRTYGGPSDMWGQTLTPAFVNSSNFGASLQAQDNNATLDREGRIDAIRITVYYDLPHGAAASVTQTAGTAALESGTLVIP
jgi:hypothetical protein